MYHFNETSAACIAGTIDERQEPHPPELCCSSNCWQHTYIPSRASSAPQHALACWLDSKNAALPPWRPYLRYQVKSAVGDVGGGKRSFRPVRKAACSHQQGLHCPSCRVRAQAGADLGQHSSQLSPAGHGHAASGRVRDAAKLSTVRTQTGKAAPTKQLTCCSGSGIEVVPISQHRGPGVSRSLAWCCTQAVYRQQA